MNNEWHFPVMILASFFVFYMVLKIVLPEETFRKEQQRIFLLALLVVVVGMLIGKYGATYGLPWWIYYPIPMLITVLLPPLLFKLSSRRTAWYLLLSFLSAPFIHFIFSFFIGWNEYMPFWEIPYAGSLFNS